MYWTAPQYLWLLLALPLLAWLWADGWRLAVLLSQQYRLGKAVGTMAGIRWGLKLLAATFLVLALAEPVVERSHVADDPGLHIFFVLDASKSMDVEDVGGGSRLELAKQAALRLADSLQGHQLGCIGFADFAYTYVPLTADYEAFRLHLSDMRTEQFAGGRTRIRFALHQVAAHFLEDGNPESWMPGGRLALLFSDGETYEPPFASKLSTLQQMEVPVIPIRIGDPQGGRVPDVRDPRTGLPALSRPDPILMDSLAQVLGTRGFHLQGAPTDAWVNQVLQQIRSTPPLYKEKSGGTQVISLFHYPLAAALFASLLILWLRPQQRRED